MIQGRADAASTVSEISILSRLIASLNKANRDRYNKKRRPNLSIACRYQDVANPIHRLAAGEWLGAGSNRRHMDFQSIALPTELPNPNVWPSQNRQFGDENLQACNSSEVNQWLGFANPLSPRYGRYSSGFDQIAKSCFCNSSAGRFRCARLAEFR